MIKQPHIRINIVPPKIKQLTVKEVWTTMREDGEFTRYFPDHCFNSDPPRNYFFSVLSAVRENILIELLERAEAHFNQKQTELANVMVINREIHDELDHVHWRYSILGTKTDKKISTKPREF